MAKHDTLRAEGEDESLRQGIDRYRSALALWKQLGSRAEEATTLLRLGSVLCNLGRPVEALDNYKQSLAI